MSQSANDWASPDPSKNMSLADADQFCSQLAGLLSLQIGTRWVVTQYNQIVSESELRQNTFLSPLPVNLYGTLAVAGSQAFNLAEFRSTLHNASSAGDPTGSLVTTLQQILPMNTFVPAMLTRIPAVQSAIATTLKTF